MGLKNGGLRSGGLRNLSELDAIPDSGVYRYEFEQDVTDSWGNNDGSNSGATYITDSQVGDYALGFDGTDDFVETFYTGLSNGEARSISCWAKADTLTSNGHIIGRFGGGMTSDMGIFVQGGSGDISSALYTGSTTINTFHNASADTWHHLVLTWDGSTIKAYTDGTEQNQNSPSSVQSSSDAMLIGRDGTSGANPFDGSIDDPRLYDKALTSTEVSNLYNNDSI